jgi:hypothetical protein
MNLVRLASVLLSTSILAACATTTHNSAPAPAPSKAAPARTLLVIDGDVTARTLSVDDLKTLGATEVEWSHRSETHKFTAVPLEAILRNAGVDARQIGASVPPTEKRTGWKLAVVATASDGFQATFSVAELYHEIGRTEAYVAIAENGAPLDATSGPFRLIVTTDREGSRSVRKLERLTVLDLRRLVPAENH